MCQKPLIYKKHLKQQKSFLYCSRILNQHTAIQMYKIAFGPAFNTDCLIQRLASVTNLKDRMGALD